MKTKNGHRGITLIALIITIIILLILAGITIGAITGENNLISQTGEAKQKTEIANEKEVVEKATIDAMGKNKYGDLEENELQSALDSQTGEGKTEIMKDSEALVVKFNESNRYYKVDSDGNVEIFEVIIDKTPGDITKDENGDELNGSEEKPYEIWSIEDLVAFSQSVNEGTKNYENCYVVLKKTLDFESIFSYSDYTTKEYDIYLGGDGTVELKTQLSKEGNGFIPIGNEQKFFGGIFDGKYHEIKNIYENTTGYAGLFGYINTSSVIIKNLGISGNITTTGEVAGGIIGWANMNKVINCYNSANITSKGQSGGIIGRTNYANTEIYNSYNKGEITGGNSGGGIIGQAYGTVGTVKIYNCCNYGKIMGADTGGIIGNTRNGIGTPNYLYNCYNTGEIAGSHTKGAILGSDQYNKEAQNCYYLNNVDRAIGNKTNTGDIKCFDENYMKSESFLNDLNTYVEQYNNDESKVEIDFIKLNNWEFSKYNIFPELKMSIEKPE